MGFSYVYKRFSPQDKAIVPFNAHKQYNFVSSSAATNRVTHYSASYTSQSVSLYSSASSNPLGVFDPINNIKYNQIDHLYYRNYKKDPSKKKDLTNHNKQRRDLYQKANILSIPSGLYGFQIRKSSFYLSSSQYEITDDEQGNLIISGTKVNDYPNDVQENVFRLDPIKGFKKYDLAVYDGYAVYRDYYDSSGGQVSLVLDPNTNRPVPQPSPLQIIDRSLWRQGSNKPDAPSTYTTNLRNKVIKDYNPYENIDEDDSYFLNELNYNNITFKESSLGSDNHKFSVINFNSATSSFIQRNHDEKINFNTNQNFSISFYLKPQSTASTGDISNDEKRYIIAKSTTKTIPAPGKAFGTIDTHAGPQFPFEIYMQSQSLYFARSDGNTINTVVGEITKSVDSIDTCQRTGHVLCQLSASVMQIWFEGEKIADTTSTLKETTRNNANLYIGSKGKDTTLNNTLTNLSIIQSGTPNIKHFHGELSHINIWNRAYDTSQIRNISSSLNASPYVGNIFYNTGIVTITHPKYHNIINNGVDGIINTVQFQGTHLIYENEYQCTVQEHEFNSTYNTSARDNEGDFPFRFANFTTSSFFKPYITTIGLYNDAYELIAVAKLGQPIRCSDETDTTFVVRFDT
tara:strand:- start:169 stop:2058 length:1890 start_codon:yes stop_codon:yes gene_type:complete